MTNIDRDNLRREAREIQAAHADAMTGWRGLVRRVLDPSSKASHQAKHDVLLSGLNRRRFLQIGGVGVLSAAVLAACGSDDNGGGAGAASGDATDSDITILRTASSLEHVAIDVYQKAIDNASALGITAGVADVAKLFQQQHREHAGLFEGATRDAGGTPFTTANPAVMEQLAERINGLASEADVLVLARDLEDVAAATYQSTVGAFDNLTYNAAAMSVGGVEARHAAVLNGVLSDNAFKSNAFHVTTGAVAAGTGV